MSDIVHENDNFTVAIYHNVDEQGRYRPVVYPFVIDRAEFESGYIVTNKKTGVVEASTPVLTEAIHFAEQANDTLIQEPWKWFAVRRQAMAEGRIEDENKSYLEAQERATARTKRPESSASELLKS